MSEITKATSQELTPSQMLGIAVQSGHDVQTIERLAALHEKWEANEARKAYMSAIVKFRSHCPKIVKDALVDFSTSKGRTTYRFASLPAADKLVQPVMEECQLAHRWTTIRQDPQWIEIKCVVSHVMGHSEEMVLGGPPDTTGNKNQLQAVKSTVSYLQRTTFFSLLGLVAHDTVDNDGADGAPQAEEKPRSAGLDDQESLKKKQKFAAACKLLQPDANLTKDQIRDLCSQVQEFLGETDIGKCAEWLSNQSIECVDGKYTICAASEPAYVCLNSGCGVVFDKPVNNDLSLPGCPECGSVDIAPTDAPNT